MSDTIVTETSLTSVLPLGVEILGIRLTIFAHTGLKSSPNLVVIPFLTNCGDRWWLKKKSQSINIHSAEFEFNKALSVNTKAAGWEATGNSKRKIIYSLIEIFLEKVY